MVKSFCIKYFTLPKHLEISISCTKTAGKVLALFSLFKLGIAVEGNITVLNKNILHCFEKINVRLSLQP